MRLGQATVLSKTKPIEKIMVLYINVKKVFVKLVK